MEIDHVHHNLTPSLVSASTAMRQGKVTFQKTSVSLNNYRVYSLQFKHVLFHKLAHKSNWVMNSHIELAHKSN